MQLSLWKDGRPDGEPDLRILSCGFGVQSTTIYLMACHGEFKDHLDAAVFADTHCEPSRVYRTIWQTAAQWSAKIPIYITSYDNLEQRMIRRSMGEKIRCPTTPMYTIDQSGRKGHLRRQCTATYKIEAIKKQTRGLLGLRPGMVAKGRYLVEQWIGISTDEAHRMKPSRDDWLIPRWPLIEKSMTRSDCIRWLKNHGYENPGKSSCVFCMYHDDKTWAWMKKHNPREFERACKFEETIQKLGMPGLDGTPYLHDSRRPLRGIDFGPAPPDDGLNRGMGNECDGLCDT